MPTLAAKPCGQCGVLVYDGTSRCAAHMRQAWQRYGNTTKRITGRRLQRERAALFARQPLCVECEKEGKVDPGGIRDHTVPLAEGGADEPANTQNLCPRHNELKRQAEALRGRGLGPK